MKLRHFFLSLSSDDYLLPNPLGSKFPFRVSTIVSDFNFQSEYITYFLSQNLAKQGFEAGEYNTITVKARKQPSDTLIYKKHLKTIEIEIKFDEVRYRDLYPFENNYPLDGRLLEPVEREGDFCDFLTSMIMAGVHKAKIQGNALPYQYIIDLLLDFRSKGHEYEWQFKSKAFREYGIKVNLLGRLTVNYFSLQLTIEKNKQLVFKQEILKTLPSVTHFHDEFKDIKIENGKLFVTRKSELAPPLFELPISEL
jgi:hypothetical protein